MNTKTVDLKNESEYVPSVRGNPADALNTYIVTIYDTKTGKYHEGLRTHHYSGEACAFWVMQNLSDGYEFVSAYNPDNNVTITKKDILKQEEGK
ncbi:hypothetical protein [Vibrio phage vB_ValP_IME271]|nr:hypothetical protein [Vibrio phage vB_ValP_IME271]